MFKKTNNNSISEESLKDLIENYESFDDPSHDLYDISRKLHVIKESNCSFHNGFLNAVNSLLDGMINLDVVERTKEKTQSSSQHADQMLGLVQENLSVLTEDVSFVDLTSDSATEVFDFVKESTNLSNDIKALVDNMYHDNLAMKEELTHLIKEIAEVKKILDIINGISNKTNLLALNATIEASRAGEVGRSFSVVADEIRVLSDHTKASVDAIKTQLNGLESKTEVVESRFSNLSQDVNICQDKIEILSENMTKIERAEQTVDQNMKTIKSNINHQSTREHLIFDHVSEVKGDIDAILDYMGETSNSFMTIAGKIDDIQKEMLIRTEAISQDELIFFLELRLKSDLWKLNHIDRHKSYDFLSVISNDFYKEKYSNFYPRLESIYKKMNSVLASGVGYESVEEDVQRVIKELRK